jgi:hypothetical protein
MGAPILPVPRNPIVGHARVMGPLVGRRRPAPGRFAESNLHTLVLLEEVATGRSITIDWLRRRATPEARSPPRRRRGDRDARPITLPYRTIAWRCSRGKVSSYELLPSNRAPTRRRRSVRAMPCRLPHGPGLRGPGNGSAGACAMIAAVPPQAPHSPRLASHSQHRGLRHNHDCMSGHRRPPNGSPRNRVHLPGRRHRDAQRVYA